MSPLIKYLKNKTDLPFLIVLILCAAAIRIFFFNGSVFSDDSYYNQLALSLLQGEYAEDYIGYPIFLLRKLNTLLTAITFRLIGFTEVGSVFFPFIFSLASIILVYRFALLLFEERQTARVAAILYSFFPTDIIFATINFTDLQCAFFVNLGLYFLYKGYKNQINKYSIYAGIFFSLSLLLKENMVFVLVLLSALQLYFFFRLKSPNRQVSLSLLIVFLFLLAEGFIYYLSNHSFGYRLSILEKNYLYCYYDFFPYTLLGTDYTTSQYYEALLKQVFVLNPKYLFLRRYYLGLPVIALIQSAVYLKQKREKLLVYWVLGMIILLLSLSTSLTDYKPFDLRRNWYIFIALMPIVMFAAKFLSERTQRIRIMLLGLYLIAGIYMSFEYQRFFTVNEINELKSFIKANENAEIFTDHSTKYGLDIIRGERLLNKTKVILGNNFPLLGIPREAFVVYSKAVIDELKLQGYSFPDLSDLNDQQYSFKGNYGKFIIYEKN